MADPTPGGDPIVIKKYANRRLYDTAASTYVTLEDLARMVREGREFVVTDARTQEDLTRQILTQIIFEEESRGQALLPVQFLRQLIGFYGGQMQGVLPGYLQMSLDAFARQQDQVRARMGPGAALMEEAVRRNMALFEQAMTLFPGFPTTAASPRPAPEPAPAPPPSSDADALAEMRRQMDEMRTRLDGLTPRPDPDKAG